MLIVGALGITSQAQSDLAHARLHHVCVCRDALRSVSRVAPKGLKVAARDDLANADFQSLGELIAASAILGQTFKDIVPEQSTRVSQ